DHRAKDHDLDRDAEDEHEHQGQRHADPEWQLEFHQERPAYPGADQQQFALREIDDLRRLVDQHERHRDHAIERADHEAVDEELEQELRVHSAASASAGLRARSTTFSVVRMRWVVPSWKRITVSTGMLASPR